MTFVDFPPVGPSEPSPSDVVDVLPETHIHISLVDFDLEANELPLENFTELVDACNEYLWVDDWAFDALHDGKDIINDIFSINTIFHITIATII